jgi:hypothetical protein
MKPCKPLVLMFVLALLIALFPQAVMAQDVTEPPPCDVQQLDALRAAIDRNMGTVLAEPGANQAQENVQVAMAQYEAYLAACTPQVEQSAKVTLLAGTGEYPPVFKTTWGSYGTANGRFDRPYNATVDSAGNVYVADSYNHRIQKFTADGTHLATWGSYSWVPNTYNDPGKFAVPVDVAVDSGGNIYVSDTGNYRIQKLKPDGSFDKMWLMIPGSSWPYCLSVDSTGTYVYVAESFNHRIQQYTTNGAFVRAWGSLGSGDGQLNRPFGVDVDSEGNVYVTEALNNRIQKFTGNGQFIMKWGGYGTGDGQFNLPFAVAADTRGNVFVAEALNNRIQKFTANGVFLTKWGSYGSGDGQFNPPYGVTVDSLGNIYVADTYNHRIQKFVEGTPPTANPTQDPPANSAGWNNSDVSVTWNWADNVGGSGIDPDNCHLTSVAAGEGVISLKATCKDLAGNTGDASYTVQIDKTPPTLAPQVIPNPIVLNGAATVAPNAADALSGLAGATCAVLDTSTVGAKSVTCVAADKADNSATAAASYSVIFNFTGFFQPVDNLPVQNVVKAGSAIPVKFSLSGNQGLNIFAAGYPIVLQIACDSGTPLAEIEQTVNAAANSLSYDPATDQYNFVWKTDKSWANTCRLLVVQFVDNTEHVADFRFK